MMDGIAMLSSRGVTLQCFLVCLLLLSRPLRSNTFGLHSPITSFQSSAKHRQRITFIKSQTSNDDNVDTEEEWLNAELVDDAEFYSEEEDWTPDRERAKQKREKSRAYQQSAVATHIPTTTKEEESAQDDSDQTAKNNVYTPEEEELISAMGGKYKDGPTKRQPGYLGDCTLQEIAQDYSVPICYIADVLTMWGVPVPINVQDRLGDLVTGEQAFAMLEAIHSLDVGALHDRYSNMNLVAVCDWYDIDIREGFEMAMKEGWSLPFGVQTCLRVEQEDELVRVLSSVA